MNDVTIGLTAPGAEESPWLAISQDQARVILGLMVLIGGKEYLTTDGRDLLATIQQVFPNLEISTALQ